MLIYSPLTSGPHNMKQISFKNLTPKGKSTEKQKTSQIPVSHDDAVTLGTFSILHLQCTIFKGYV